MFTRFTIQSFNRRLPLLLLFVCLMLHALINSAQVLTGQLTDEQNNPIPYATIFIPETKEGTTSNVDGYFHFQLPRGNYNLNIRSMGYHQIDRLVRLQADSLFLPIQMKTQAFEIKEVKIFPGKEDPAYFIMRKAMAKAPYYRKKIKHYSADLYIKSNFAFSNIPKLYQNQITMDDGKKLKDYFKENVTYVIESQNKITYDYPNTYDQKVISKKTSLVGFDEPPVMGLITTSIYEERPFQVISPLSAQALKHYNFQYEGYITVGDFDVFKIKVDPKRQSDELLEGFIYIVDKLWCVYNMDFNSSFEFFKMRIKQQFQNLGNGDWLPVSYNISGNVSMLGLRGTFYYGASVKYDSIVDNYYETIQKEISADKVEKIEKQEIAKTEKEVAYAKEIEQLQAKEKLSNADVRKVSRLNRKVLKEQYNNETIEVPSYNSYQINDNNDSLKTELAWDTVRAIPLTPAEIASYKISDSIMRLETMDRDSMTTEDLKAKRKSTLTKIAFGHYDLCKDSLIRLGYDGLLSVEAYDFNAVDGYKYKQSLRFRFYTDSAKSIHFTPMLGYAFNRKALFGSISTRFINILGYGNTVSLKGGKLSRDFKDESTAISPLLNAFSSWVFGENYMRLYETEFVDLKISQRLNRKLSLYGGVDYNHFYPLENNISYPLSDNKDFEPNIPKGFEQNDPALLEQKSFAYELGLNYRKRMRKPWLEESPFLFMDDYYAFSLSFKQGLPDVFNSISDFSVIHFKWNQQANITPTSGIDWQLNAGHFFSANQMHFSQFKHFRTAEIPVLLSSFSNTFQLLNDYEFSTNESYLHVGADFRTEYLLLRYLSFLNKKTWSESLHFNYLTTPALENYWEAGYSLNSLFFVGNIGVFTGFKGTDFESISVKVSLSVFDE